MCCVRRDGKQHIYRFICALVNNQWVPHKIIPLILHTANINGHFNHKAENVLLYDWQLWSQTQKRTVKKVFCLTSKHRVPTHIPHKELQHHHALAGIMIDYFFFHKKKKSQYLKWQTSHIFENATIFGTKFSNHKVWNKRPPPAMFSNNSIQG